MADVRPFLQIMTVRNIKMKLCKDNGHFITHTTVTGLFSYMTAKSIKIKMCKVKCNIKQECYFQLQKLCVQDL